MKGETKMNKEIADGKWKQFKGELREKWGDISDDELEQARGRRENLIGKIKEKYGESKEEIEKKLDKLWKNVS